VIALGLDEVARAVGGRLVPPSSSAYVPTVDGPVVTDSREASMGSLYVARQGDTADGHDFVAVAVAAGAVASVVSRELDQRGSAGSWQVVVDDTERALGRLARYVIDRLGDRLTVVAVTGSSGKTSTKDLVAALLSDAGPTVAARESYNSEVGVPLTVLRVTDRTRFLVVEMGSRGLGHLTYLTGIAPPDVAVVLNVGHAHSSEFGGLDVVEAAKGELVEALEEEGTAVLNVDDERVRRMAARTSAGVVRVGTHESADVRAADVVLDDEGRASFTLHSPQGSADVSLRLHGEHHVGNALAAAAVGLRLGMPVGVVATALSAAVPVSRWRMEVTDRADGVRVVNDAYNANPDSVRAALKALATMGRGTLSTGAAGGPRRTWAVLGEMLELGESSTEQHDAIGRLVVQLDVSRLVVVGEGARPVHTGACQERSRGDVSAYVPDVDAAYALLRDELRAGDVVLFKSSRDAGLRWLGDRVAGDDDAAASRTVGAGGGPR